MTAPTTTYTLLVEGVPFRDDLTAAEVEFLVAALRSGDVKPTTDDLLSLDLAYNDSGPRIDVKQTAK